MKVAYVTVYDASDVKNWSGLGYYIAKTLTESNFRLEYIGNLKEDKSLFLKGKQLFYRKFSSKRFLRNRDPHILKSYAKQISSALDKADSEIVFSPGTIPIAYLETDRPIIFWTDSTFAGLVDFYPRFTNLCTESIKNGNRMEQEALSRCRLAIYSSEWAARTAVENYEVDPEKVKIVPFGANVDFKFNFEYIKRIIELRCHKFDKCNLLFCGVDWYRKGGDIALEIANTLNTCGLETELHIVGCKPPMDMPKFAKLHGFISKRTKEGREILRNLFANSHFLILPSRADCFGTVFAEASLFGLPSVSTNVGGISTAIKDGRNGKAFSIDTDIEEYSRYIRDVMSSREKYRELAFSSFREYESRLNWSSSGNSVRQLIQQYCG